MLQIKVHYSLKKEENQAITTKKKRNFRNGCLFDSDISTSFEFTSTSIKLCREGEVC